MSFLNRIISLQRLGPDLLRLVLCAIVFVHGMYRYDEGSLPIMGKLLELSGFPKGSGYALACVVNLVETFGAVFLALRIMVWPLCAAFSVIYFTGIIIFHREAGFFVVGPGSDGWEYSALLITCFVAVAWENRSSRYWPLGQAEEAKRPSLSAY